MGAETAVALTATEVLAISAATAAASAGASAAIAAQQQRQQSNQAKEASKRQAAAKAENDRQRATQLAVEQQKAVRGAQQVSGRIRTVAAESGIGLTGSYAALDQQSAIDNGRTISNLNMSAAFANRSSQSQLDNTLAELATRGGSTSAIIAQGVQGAFSGFSTGLSIGSSLNSATSADQQLTNQQELLRLQRLQPVLPPR